MKKLIIAGLSLCAAQFSFAAANPLSVHVLNLETGLPSSNVEVTLEEQIKGKWVQISQSKTNENGRITALYPENKNFHQGLYKVTFKQVTGLKHRNRILFSPKFRSFSK